ncbi:MAG: alpha-ketoacid dehydrogenase subunit alpha/beta [Solitalea-like symbiont of Acarus siro]
MDTGISSSKISFTEFKRQVIDDYYISYLSRQASIAARQEVFAGKAKFAITGDGKELPQVALSKVFKQGDYRAGYYRDQTFMLASGDYSLVEYFSQLYGTTNDLLDPATAGRSMNNHFATRFLDENGNFMNMMQLKISAADLSPTGAQMLKLLGLAQASKLYRTLPELSNKNKNFTNKGNEVAFGTIGDASTSEGYFFESLNAAGIMQVPMLISVWDDGYGISVDKSYQTTKSSISEIMQGFKKQKDTNGIEIFTVKGWDYVQLCKTYDAAANICREKHIPVLVHVTELTQPQGHSSSGSHERYKTIERLNWEQNHDCLKKMREWILEKKLASEQELQIIEEEAGNKVIEDKNEAWQAYMEPINAEKEEFLSIISQNINAINDDTIKEEILFKYELLKNTDVSNFNQTISIARELLITLRGTKTGMVENIKLWLNNTLLDKESRYSSYLFTDSNKSVKGIQPSKPVYDNSETDVEGYKIINACFDANFSRDPGIIAFGEDVGKIGDVNQGFAGLQEKYGQARIFDTGIREATIVGQAIGLAMRGFRPIAEIQYIDYIYYALEALADDLATLSYRTKGGQKAPVIIRTRGHRLEGIWHSGSPMGVLINALRGMHVLVPRNFTQAAGFYNTLLRSDEPALLIECLNSYRIKEKMPINIGDYCLPLGQPEILSKGNDITLVTYGSCCRIAESAIVELDSLGISVELIDIQSLLPFDTNKMIQASIERTNRLVILDEDVPGGASAYILQQIIQEQDAYKYLDSKPTTITAKAHRPAYASDGDYFSKPNKYDIIEHIYKIMSEAYPQKFKEI